MKQKLALLQQAEYDLPLWREWIAAHKNENLAQTFPHLKPENETSKLKLIAALSTCLAPFGQDRAISWATRLLLPLQYGAAKWKIWQAQRKLRRAQEHGLTVIALAGSYGKTTTKHLIAHVVSQKRYTAVTPGSINTPLGNAEYILEHLTPKHDIFLAELGEYQEGDLSDLLSFLRPDITVVTPIGYTHGDRFGSPEARNRAFQELTSSRFASSLILSHDSNRAIFANTPSVSYYAGKEGAWRIASCLEDLEATQAELVLPQQTVTVRTNLSEQAFVENSLPGFWLLQQMGYDSTQHLSCLEHVPAIERRLQVLHNPNGSVVIDNSYNTNPGTWRSHASLMKKLKRPLCIIVSGYVELDPQENSRQHQELAQNLLERADCIGVISSRFNSQLVEALQAKSEQKPVIISTSLDGVLTQLRQQKRKFSTLWIEGGMRELYQ